MVISFQITAVICLLIQIIGFIIYFQKFVLIKIFPYSESKVKWKKNRDNFILSISICFFALSFLMALKIGFTNIYFNYTYAILVLAMTILILLFYLKKFKVFETLITKKTSSKNQILIRDMFELKKISEEELSIIVKERYSNSFSSDFEIFKKIFINRESTEEKLVCINRVERSKKISYSKIFELMHDLTENGILDIWEEQRSNFLSFTIENFKKGDERISKKNIDSAFSKWLKTNR